MAATIKKPGLERAWYPIERPPQAEQKTMPHTQLVAISVCMDNTVAVKISAAAKRPHKLRQTIESRVKYADQ